MTLNYLRAVALPLSLLASAIAAASGGPHDKIEELVITASPHGKTSGDVPGSLNILSGDVLRREAAATLGETLKGQVGVNTSSFGPDVGLPVIRGLSGSRVEVLQNNSPVADASRTSPDHAIAIEPLLADRIEILRGPAVLRYGPGASGGVVNIIDNRIHTEPHEGLDGALEGRYNSNNHGRAWAGRLDGGNGPFTFHVGGLLRESSDLEIPGFAALDTDDPDDTTNGHVANTDTDAEAWSLGVSRVTDSLVMGFGISRIDNEYGIPPGGHGHHHHEEDEHDDEHDDEHEGEHEDENEHESEHENGDDQGDLFTRILMRQTEYSGKLLFPDLPGLFNKLDIDLTHSDYKHREMEIEDGNAAVGTRYATRQNALRAELTHDIGGWLGALGIQARDTGFSAEGEEAFVPTNDVRIAGIFLTEEIELGAGTLGLGLRFDRQRAEAEAGPDASHNLVNASASYLADLGGNQQLGLILSHSQRAPTAEELFAEGAHAATRSYQVGDVHLDREAANSLEITWSWDGPVQLSASIYHRRFGDFIFEATDGSAFSHHLEEEGFTGAAACSADLAAFDNSGEEFAEALPCYFYRQENARFSGAEVEAIALVNDNTSVRLWGDTVRGRLDSSGDVPRLPPARIGANLDYSRDIWVAGIGVTHGFRQNRPGANEAATDSYTSVDAHVSLGNDSWTLFLRGTNLTDEEIRNSTSFLRALAPEPGRSIEVGGRLHF